MKSRNYRISILALIFFLLAACSAAPVQPGPRSIVIDSVPFYPQEDYQCGPASLAGVLNYLGKPVTPEKIAKDIYSGSAKGTLNLDMLLYAQRTGLDVLQYSGNWNDLKTRIDGGYPLIVLVDYGFLLYQVNHFMVVIGYNEKGIIANSGKEERTFIDKDSFLKSWKRTNFWTLLIRQ